MNFGKTVFASMLGSALSFLLVGAFLVLLMVGLITSAVTGALSGLSGDDSVTSVKDNSVLHLKLEGGLIERGNEKGGSFDFSTFQTDNSIGLNHFVENLEKAKDDDRVEGIFLEMGAFGGAPSTLQDVRDAITDFKTSGKWVVAYSEGYGQSAYYVASAADEVYLYPEGSLNIYGLATELMFFKNMLDRLGIDVQVIRGPNNKFKSAAEGFMREDMSPANREQIEAFLNDIWNHMVNDMANDRGMTVADINAVADSLQLRVADDAVEYGFVDGLMYRDQVMDLLLAKTTPDSSDEAADDEDAEGDGDDENEDEDESVTETAEDKINFVTFAEYRKAKIDKKDDEDKDEVKSWKKDKVAVVYAVGAIESGEGDDQTIGSERIAEAIRTARLDEKVKAVVLRVNSPGGSALASDVIWRETMLLKESGKPFVVSMGDLAASGGYYISAGAAKIFANPTTITGSIGVFGVLPNMEKMFNEKLGLTFDRASTNAHGNYMTVTRPLDEVEMASINESVTDIYTTFINLVAEGRGMTPAQVDSIAQGRVWTGIAAKEIGLVDELGNLDDAIEAAAAMAQLEDFTTRELPKMKDPLEELVKQMSGDAQAARMLTSLGIDQRYIKAFRDAQRMVESNERIQARLPYEIIIE